MRTIIMSYKVIIQFDNIRLCKTQEVCPATPGRITKLRCCLMKLTYSSPTHPYLRLVYKIIFENTTKQLGNGL